MLCETQTRHGDRKRSPKWRRTTAYAVTFLLLELTALQVDARVVDGGGFAARGSAALGDLYKRSWEAAKSVALNTKRLLESRSGQTQSFEKRTPHNKTVWVSAKTYQGPNFFE
ncbi:hypothetical protein FRC19_000934 [Serendipita sp. 401]|nr:hypothetical protein FRC19_000934 [Serendipita sp. 401]